MAPWPGVMRSAARYDRSASSSRPDLCRAIASATSFWNSLAASASMVQSGCCEMSTTSRRRLAAARALPTLWHRNARENGLPKFGRYMAGPSTADKRSDTTTAVSGR